ncbi:MAG: hypothetical protein PVH54_07565 [Gammaproteobacteria bacterium]
MTNDIKNNDSPDETADDPVAVVLMLQQEAGNGQQDNRLSRPLKQAEIKERVLRRMLDNSLEHTVPARKPHLKIVK